MVWAIKAARGLEVVGIDEFRLIRFGIRGV